jgi:hypothetical protein
MLKTVMVASALFCGVLVVGAAGPAQANYVVNGTFSDPNVGTGWAPFANGDVPGWTNPQNNDGLEIDSTLVVFGMPEYGTETQSLEVDGSTFGTAAQTINGLTVGANYLFSWGYGDRPGSGPQQLDVYFGDTLVTSDIGSGSGEWTANSFVVTATSSSETISFVADVTDGNPSVGNEIADVSLVDAPEPAAVALFGAGLFGIFLIRYGDKTARAWTAAG